MSSSSDKFFPMDRPSLSMKSPSGDIRIRTSSNFKSTKTITPMNTQDKINYSDKIDDLTDIELNKHDLNFTSKLPAVTELINLRQRSIDPQINQVILNLTKYAQNLEHIIRFKNKEIQRLEYINKYLVISQQKRDEMLTHTLEENRKLKEMSLRMERKIPDKKKPNNNAGSPTHKDSNFNPRISTWEDALRPKTTMNLSGTENRVHGKKLDDKKTQSVIKMTEEDINTMYAENESIIFLEELTSKGDEFFANELKNYDDYNYLRLNHYMLNVLEDHRSLRQLLFKVKRILKATSGMATSLVLNEAIEKIVDEICECLDCDRATIFIYDTTKEELWCKVAKGSDELIRVPANKGIVGHVFVTGEPLNVLDAYTDERFMKDVDLKTGFKTNTILAVPIKDDSGRILGVGEAINKRGHASFNKDDEGLLSILFVLAGIILRNSMIYDEEVRYHNSLRTALRSGIVLLSQHSFEKLIPIAESKLMQLMGVQKARVMFKHPVKNILFSIGEDGYMREYPTDCGVAGKVMQTGEFENLTNGYANPLFNGKVDIETSMPLLVYPIKNFLNEKVVGVMEVINSRGIQGLSSMQKANITKNDIETIEFLSKQLAQAALNCLDWEKTEAKVAGKNSRFEE